MVLTKNWEQGGGAVTITYDGDGDGTISFSSDANSGTPRKMTVTVENEHGNSAELLVKQAGIYDAEVEYLETNSSAGVCYIRTNYIPSGADISYETKFRWTSWGGSSTTYIRLFGASTSTSTQAFMMWRYKSTVNQTKIYCGQRGWANSGVGKNMKSGQDVVLRADVSSANYNGEVKTFSEGAYSSVNKQALRLWPTNVAISLRFYYFKMWKGENLVLDLIPVRKGTTGYMYDRVSGQLLENGGTGDFILGSDVE